VAVDGMGPKPIVTVKRNIPVSAENRIAVIQSHSQLFYRMDHCSIVGSSVKYVVK
jgi:hypothetical protein